MNTKTSGDLQVSYEESLFFSPVIWYPGLTVQKSFSVKNLGSSTQTVLIKADNTSQTGALASNLLFKVTEGGITKYGGNGDKTMKNFWDDGQINLSDINRDAATKYDITITLPSALDNDLQNTNAKFDLIIGFAGTNSQVKGAATQLSPKYFPWKEVLGLIFFLTIILIIFRFFLFRFSKK